MYGICYGTLATGVDAFKRPAEKHWLPVFNGPKQQKYNSETSFYNYAQAQVGFSLHMNSRDYGADIVLGSPGVYVWRGDAILITAAFNGSASQTIIPSVVKETRIDFHSYFGNVTFLISPCLCTR